MNAHPTWANAKVDAVNVEAVGVEVAAVAGIEAFNFKWTCR